MLLAVVLTQTLGVLHGIAHAPHGELHAPAHAHAHDEDAGYAYQNPQDHLNGQAPLARFFGGHAADSDCRLYDHASHADTLPTVALLALPLVWAQTHYRFLARFHVAQRHAPCQARAPPPR
jgi:hypothetical protein